MADELDKQLEKGLGDKVPEKLKKIIKPNDVTDGLKRLMGGNREQK